MTRYRYTEDRLADAVAQSFSIAGVMRILQIKPAGGSHFHVSKRIKKANLDTSHFTRRAHNRGKRYTKIPAELILVKRSPSESRTRPHMLRRALIEIGTKEACSECGAGTLWQEKLLVLHVDHIDGDASNNVRENLRFLCPNCHSQTSTYCRKMSARAA